MIIVGITGSFGVGKSTVCRMMQKYGATWIEADSIVHELYKPGRIGYQKIAGYFGKEFIDPKKGVKRDRLRKVVLKNPQKLWILQKLIHPFVFHEIKELIHKIKKQNQTKIVCIESLYFEKADCGKNIDSLIEVRRKPKLVRKSRAKEQKWNLEDIDRFMKLSPIFPKADVIIENNGSLAELKTKVHSLLATQNCLGSL